MDYNKDYKELRTGDDAKIAAFGDRMKKEEEEKANPKKLGFLSRLGFTRKAAAIGGKRRESRKSRKSRKSRR